MYVHTILRGTLYKSTQQVGCYVLVKKRWQWLKAHASHCSAVTKITTKTQWMLSLYHTCSIWIHSFKNVHVFHVFFHSLFPMWDSHSKRHISTFIISLRGSYSPASASSTQASFPSKVSAGCGSLKRQAPIWISLCPSVRLSPCSFLTIHLSKPLWHDTLNP